MSVNIDRGWHCSIFRQPSSVSVCWLTCPRKTLLRCTSWVEHEYIHPSPWGTSKSLCLFCQLVCLVWSDVMFYICADLVYFTNPLSPTASSIYISWSRFVDTCVLYSQDLMFYIRARYVNLLVPFSSSILFNHMSWFHCWHVCLLWSELDVLYPFGIILLIIYLLHPQHCLQFFMVHANGTSPTHVVDSNTLDIITWFTSKHI